MASGLATLSGGEERSADRCTASNCECIGGREKQKALAPPPEARAALPGSILGSLDDEPADEGVEAAWNEEIKRRIEEIDSAKVQMIPYEEVRRRLDALLSDASKQAVPLHPPF
jgi:putative addiction module component (TIGR02574 family)